MLLQLPQVNFNFQVGNSSGNADSAEMLGFYGEEEVRYDETSSACPNIDPGSAPPKPVETLPPPEGDLVSTVHFFKSCY